MSLGYDTSNGVPLGLPSIVSLGLTPGINPYPALDLDFIQNPLDSRITFSRGTTATYFNSLGVLTTAGTAEARFDFNPSTLQPLGLLIEEQRTNSIRNNTMQGAVAGTPGTDPTNWVTAGAGGGITSKTIAAVTSENGVSCIDYRYVFNASGTANIRTEATTQTAAAVGQTWTASAYLKLQGGLLSNLTINIVIRECDAGGATLVETAQAFTPTTANLATQRATLTRTLAAVGTAFVVAIVQFSASGAADATLRIGLPQLEQGAFATSVVATTTTALTRNADVASMTGTNFSSWFNSAQGTMIAEFSRNTTPAASTFPQFFNIDDGSVNNRLALFTNSSLAMTGQVAISGVFTSLLTGQSWSLGVPSKLGLAYQALNHAASANGSTVVTNTAVNVPSGLIAARIGNQAGGGADVNGWIRRVSFYPTRLPDTTLQALTA